MLKLRFFLPSGEAARSALLNERFAVERIMRSPPVTATPHTAVAEASEIMAREGIHALPIVDDQDALVGILTTTDVMRAALEGSPRRTAVEQPSNGGARSDTRKQAPVPRPTLIELKDALATAELRYFDSEDPRALGKVLLYLHARSEKLDRVRHLAERLLAAGLDSQVHGQLVRALEDLALFDAQGPGAAPEPFGLEPSEAGERAASH